MAALDGELDKGRTGTRGYERKRMRAQGRQARGTRAGRRAGKTLARSAQSAQHTVPETEGLAPPCVTFLLAHPPTPTLACRLTSFVSSHSSPAPPADSPDGQVAFKSATDAPAATDDHIESFAAKIEAAGGSFVLPPSLPLPQTLTKRRRIKHRYNSRIMRGFAGSFGDDIKRELEKNENVKYIGQSLDPARRTGADERLGRAGWGGVDTVIARALVSPVLSWEWQERHGWCVLQSFVLVDAGEGRPAEEGGSAS